MSRRAREGAATFSALRRRGPATSFSMATRLATVALVIVLVSLTVVSFVGISSGRDIANDVNERRIANIGVSRAGQVERYMAGLRQQVGLLAGSPATVRSIQAFVDATGTEVATAAERQTVIDYYETTVVPDLLAVRNSPIGVPDLLPSATQSIALQADYVVGADALEQGMEDEAADDEQGAGGATVAAPSAWDAVHEELHPIYRDIAAAAGFADLYLIGAQSDYVGYSVAKDIDFATSLDVGPHSGSTLAELVQAVIAAPDDGVSVSDFAPYTPAGEQPVLFMAAAVVDGGVVVGAVAARIDTSGITSIMTDDGIWDDFGATGETYLVGPDDTVRSEVRPFVESRAAFTDRLLERAPSSADEVRRLDRLDTTVKLLAINDEPLELARAGGAGSIDTVNYLGVDVRTAYRPLDVEGVDWVLLTEVASDELAQPVVDYARDLLVAIAVIIVVVTFAIVFWSRRVVAPLVGIAERLRAIRQDRPPPDLVDRDARVPPPREFEELSDDIDAILERWQARRVEIEERSAERRDLVRRFLPAGIVDRVEAGEQDVIDRLENVTVVTVVLHGLGSIVDVDVATDSRAVVERIVDLADGVATHWGLDRITLTGDGYTAICGTNKPYLDHASRGVSFGLEIAEIVQDVSEEIGTPLRVGVGVDTGPVTVGLTGGVRLLYDAWGATVSTSRNVARVATGSGVIVTPTTAAQLSAHFRLVDDANAGFADTGLVRVVGVLADDVVADDVVATHASAGKDAVR